MLRLGCPRRRRGRGRAPPAVGVGSLAPLRRRRPGGLQEPVPLLPGGAGGAVARQALGTAPRLPSPRPRRPAPAGLGGGVRGQAERGEYSTVFAGPASRTALRPLLGRGGRAAAGGREAAQP